MTELVRLGAGAAEALLAPECGGSIAGWTLGGIALMRPMQEGALAERRARGMASYPLVPYSNRVARRRFNFAGVDHELPALLNGYAIHGVGWQCPWRVSDSGPAHATLALDHAPGPLWPFAFRATQRFTLTEDALVCELAIENRHGGDAPAGFGLHPYFPRHADTVLAFSADHVWHNGDPDMTPVRRGAVPPEWDHAAGLRVGAARLDNCFAGWGGRARILQPAQKLALTITADPVFRHLVVFVPEGQDFFAVEPVSNMNDGLNRMDGTTDHGVFVLAPGEVRSGTVRFAVAHAD